MTFRSSRPSWVNVALMRLAQNFPLWASAMFSFSRIVSSLRTLAVFTFNGIFGRQARWQMTAEASMDPATTISSGRSSDVSPELRFGASSGCWPYAALPAVLVGVRPVWPVRQALDDLPAIPRVASG